MKAYAYKKTGKASNVLKLLELPSPQPKKNEVRVQVRASGVTLFDTKKRSGELPQAFNAAQVIPHFDGSGVIDRVGTGVDVAWVGKRVWFHISKWNNTNGAAAEYVVLPFEEIAHLPEQISFSDGATLGAPLLTAWYSVHIAGLLSDKVVFVEDGASSVGAYAIQLAKQKGAKVISSVSTKEQAKLARCSGADYIVNNKENGIIENILEATNGQGIDLYIKANLDVNEQLIPNLLAPDASIVIYSVDKNDLKIGNISQFQIKRTKVIFFIVHDLPQHILRQAKEDIQALLISNGLSFNTEKVYNFADIVQAHEAVECGDTGNAVLCQCPLQIANHLQK